MMTTDEHIQQAESWMKVADRPDVSANLMVSALCVLKALTHATLAQTMMQRGERHERWERER